MLKGQGLASRGGSRSCAVVAVVLWLQPGLCT